MDFTLSKEQELIQKMAREYARKNIAPIAEQIDKENKVLDEMIAEMGKLDLFGIPFAEDYGGADGGYDQYVLAMEQISRASAGAALILSAHTLALSAINAFGTEEQKKKYMPLPCKGKQIASFAFTEPGTGQFAKEAALTKTYVSETLADAARVSIDVHGSYGCMEDYAVSRIYRDAIIAPQIEGVSDMQKMIIAGVILK